MTAAVFQLPQSMRSETAIRAMVLASTLPTLFGGGLGGTRSLRASRSSMVASRSNSPVPLSHSTPAHLSFMVTPVWRGVRLGIDETGGKSVEVFNRICDLVVTDHTLGHRHRHRGSFRLAKRQRARNHVAVSRQPLAGHRANH